MAESGLKMSIGGLRCLTWAKVGDYGVAMVVNYGLQGDDYRDVDDYSDVEDRSDVEDYREGRN